jgi:hypothetical protein
MRAQHVIIALLLSALPVAAKAPPPEVHGKSAILVDVRSGRVLFSKNSREQRAVALVSHKLAAILCNLESQPFAFENELLESSIVEGGWCVLAVAVGV